MTISIGVLNTILWEYISTTNKYTTTKMEKLSNKIARKNNILTVNLRHQTDNQRISRILLPIGNFKMMSVLLCARKTGGSL